MGDVELGIVNDEEKKELNNPENGNHEAEKLTNGNGAVKPISATKLRHWKQFIEALHATSVRGLSRAMTKKKKKFKVYWLTVFIFALVIFIINLKNITVRFMNDPILTQLERQNQPFTWPHFTFCSPANPIPFWKDETLYPTWKSMFKNAEDNYTLPDYDPSRPRKIWEHYMTIASIYPHKFYSQLVNESIYKFSVIYEDPSIVEYSSPLDLYRDVKDFTKVFDVRLYTLRSPIACYTLLPEKLPSIVKMLNQNHTVLGIKIYLIMDLMSYLKFDMGFENRKLYFYVTQPNSTMMSTFPYYIMPGTDSTFLIKQSIHKRIAHCTKKVFEFELFDISMLKTTKFKGGFEDCRTFLSQQQFVQKCKCYNPYLPVYKFENQAPILCTNMSVFNNEEMSENIQCLNTFLEEKSRHPDHPFATSIKNTCNIYQENPCVESTYGVSRYTTTWQSTMSESRKNQTITGSRLLPNAPPNATEAFPRENLAILKLEWARTKTEVTFEQFAYPLSRFMSDFGGIVGLWIGLSVFSIFEFLEILYRFIKYKRDK